MPLPYIRIHIFVSDLDTVILSLEKVYLFRIQYEFMPVPYDINKKENIATIQLGRQITKKFRTESSVCIGKAIFLNNYFNTTQPVYQVDLFSIENDEHALDSRIDDYDIIINIPVKNSENSSKVILIF